MPAPNQSGRSRSVSASENRGERSLRAEGRIASVPPEKSRGDCPYSTGFMKQRKRI
ncbi:MAG: hypothetical protein F6J93_09585 [Oscillatoria sp. SIO1A7]|nr:hypothetical protein [Oscillatoria sp. SIO1A7]